MTAYSHLTQPRATMQIDGQTLKQALNELFNSPKYNQGVDADAHAATTSLGEESRGYMVSQVFNRYNAVIKAEVAAAYPTALRYMTAAAAKHRDAAYFNTTPLDDLVSNPSLYATHGVDPTAYSDKITQGAAGDLLPAMRGGGQ